MIELMNVLAISEIKISTLAEGSMDVFAAAQTRVGEVDDESQRWATSRELV